MRKLVVVLVVLVIFACLFAWVAQVGTGSLNNQGFTSGSIKEFKKDVGHATEGWTVRFERFLSKSASW